MKKENTSKMNLSQEDFGLVQSMLSQRVGISLASGKEYLVVNRLSPLVDTFKFDSLHGLIQTLYSGNNVRLWDEVVDVWRYTRRSSFVITHLFNSSSEKSSLPFVTRARKLGVRYGFGQQEQARGRRRTASRC